MTAAEILEYVSMAGKGKAITLHGYTSCSLDQRVAMSFAWDDHETSHTKVLVHFKWMSKYNAYYMDAGAYDFEEEVLLWDGALVYVESVQEVSDPKGQVQYTLITLKTFYAK